MKTFTKNIGRSNLPKNIDSTIEIKRVLICRANHRLGNLLLISPLIQDVAETFPNAKIDLVTQGGIAPILYENYESIDTIIQLPKKPFKNLIKYFRGVLSIRKRKYDLVINATQGSSSGKLFTIFAKSKYKVFGEENDKAVLKNEDHHHIAKYQVYSFRNYLSKLSFNDNTKPVPRLDLKLSSDEIAKGGGILKDIVKNNKKTISIFTFATGDKCYSTDWWTPFYERLKEEFSDYNIVEVLPMENVSQIAFKAPTFYSRELREIGAVIANTEVFIGADSGIMHLASASETSTLGLFSRDNQKMYQPYNNNSLAINTNKVAIDGYIKIVKDVLNK